MQCDKTSYDKHQSGSRGINISGFLSTCLSNSIHRLSIILSYKSLLSVSNRETSLKDAEQLQNKMYLRP